MPSVLSVDDSVYDRSWRSFGRHSQFYAYADDDSVAVRLVQLRNSAALAVA